jgi:hypothetical protein
MATLTLAVVGPSAASQRVLHADSQADRHSITLDHGFLSGQPWRSQAFRAHGRPCYQLETHFSGSSNAFFECGRPRRGFIPTIEGRSGNGARRGSLLLVITPMRVTRVHLNLGGRPDRNIWPRPINRAMARKANLKRNFRYKTLARKGNFCLRRHVDFERGGDVYFKSFPYPRCSKQ